MIVLTHKTEIFPSDEQIKQIEISFGMRRFFFNKTIMTLKHRYGNLKENKKLIKKKEIMGYRREVFRSLYPELTSTVTSHVLDCSIEDVMFSLNSLWKKGKDVKLRKKKNSNTFRICRSGTKPDGSSSSFHIDSEDTSKIRLPKIGFIKMAESLRWEYKPNTIRTATVKKEANRYFICITCEIDSPAPTPKTNKSVGIDWGIKTYITGFDGENIIEKDFDNIKLIKLDKKIAKCNKSLARKVRFSKNWLKAKIKLSQSHLDFVNYRHNVVNEIVNDFVKTYDSVTMEDLGMGFVTRNKRLANKARRKPYYLLKVALVNKFNQYNKPIYLVNKSYPSTQTCYNCNHVKSGDEKMKLGESTYVCGNCGHIDDRDHNAAKNLWACKDVSIATIEE